MAHKTGTVEFKSYPTMYHQRECIANKLIKDQSSSTDFLGLVCIETYVMLCYDYGP